MLIKKQYIICSLLNIPRDIENLLIRESIISVSYINSTVLSHVNYQAINYTESYKNLII